MDNFESWKAFESTGKVEDYLKYAEERKVKDACKNFISAVEGESTNGRDDYGSGNSDFFDGYK